VRNLDALNKAMATFEEGLRFDAALIHHRARGFRGARCCTRPRQARDPADGLYRAATPGVRRIGPGDALDDDRHPRRPDARPRRAHCPDRRHPGPSRPTTSVSPADASMLGSIVRRLEELEAAEARRQLRPWYRPEHLAEELQGSRSEVLAAYRPLAERFAGSAPVADLGCGRGELLEALGDLGVEALGVEADAELAKAATGHGVAVDHDDAVGARRHRSGVSGRDRAARRGAVPERPGAARPGGPRGGEAAPGRDDGRHPRPRRAGPELPAARAPGVPRVSCSGRRGSPTWRSTPAP